VAPYIFRPPGGNYDETTIAATREAGLKGLMLWKEAMEITDMEYQTSAHRLSPGDRAVGSLPPVTPGITTQAGRPPHQPPGPPGRGPLVTFARSGITAPFGGDWRSVLDLADACDVPTRWSCRTGVCHTCVTPLLSGDITYTPDPLELPADGQVLICCARAATDTVLDM